MNRAAKDFLERYSPSGPWVLTAISVDKKIIKTKTFRAEGQIDLESWLARHAQRNIYFHVNSTMRDLAQKAKRDDIKSVDWLHVDVDPRAGEDLVEEQKRILKRFTTNLPEGVPKPTCIIFSGGGYQGFWRLQEPIQIDGDKPRAEDAKLWNKWLEAKFGGDSCHNIDRIMRLPGTVNHPNEEKKKKGRKPALAKLVEFNDATHPLSDFKQSKASPGQGTPGGATPAEETGGAIDDLSQLPPRVATIIRNGAGPEDKEGDNSRSAWLFDVCCNLIRHGMSDDAIHSIITNPEWEISKSVLDKRAGGDQYARAQIAKAHKEVDRSPVVLQKGVPMHNARQFVRLNWPTLKHWNDDYLIHSGTSYLDIEDETVRSEMWLFMERSLQPGKKKNGPGFLPFSPSKKDVSDALDAVRGLTHVKSKSLNPPCWLDGRTDPDPRGILACQNGLLHLPTMELLPGDPAFFTRNALDFDYETSPPPPVQWLAFLDDLFGDDEKQIILLQEIMGYFLLPDTSQQKLFYIKGPTRSGKGTINRVVFELVGSRNCTAPSLSNLQGFGLAALIGKQLATISDMRIGRFTNLAEVVSTLLRVTGEDPITAERKFKGAWHGVLGTRFLILSNDDVEIKDTSGALANRFIGILLTESFLGKEDRRLTKKLCAELPGILLWAIDGWRSLNERGHFIATTQSKNIVRQVHEGSDKVTAFFYARCKLDPNAETRTSAMFTAYERWMDNEFRNDKRLGKTVFSKKLLACTGGDVKKVRQTTEDGDRVYAYRGIRFLNEEEMLELADRAA